MRRNTPHQSYSRRRFLRAAGSSVAVSGLTPWHASNAQSPVPASERLRLAFIGVGGRGRNNLRSLAGLGHEIVAMCDVDAERAKESFADFPKAKRFVDFRRMLDQVDSDTDGVVISTPDHTHAVATIDALRRGKHVYCEKPLAHSIDEVRAMQTAAREANVVTQMGNQGHSFDSIRLFCEWIWDGAIGDVHTIHALRPSSYSRIKDLPQLAERPEVPEGLDWDLWLGGAAQRPYHPAFIRGKWRGWQPFGSGVIGDWACHVIDPVFWALDLGAPESVVAEVQDYDPSAHALTFAPGCHLTFQFGAKGERGPVTLHWYDGSMAPPKLDGFDWKDFPKNTCGLVLGSEGAIRYSSHGARGVRIVPEEKMLAYQRPEPTIHRVANHHQDWVDAIKQGRAAGSNFEYGGALTELALLGNIACRMPSVRLQWNGPAGRFTNSDAANKMLTTLVP